MRQEFKDRLSQAMELKGLHEKDLAHLFGVSFETVARWLDGTNEPHPAMQAPMFIIMDLFRKA